MLRAKAEEVRKAHGKRRGTRRFEGRVSRRIPQINVKVNLAKAHEYGIKPGDVRRAAATMVAGEEIGDIHIANRTYDINVWSTPETRNSLTSIQNLPIDTPSGKMVRLADVAEFAIKPTPNIVKHENLKRSIDVGANVKGRDLGSVAAGVEAALKTVEFPLEYHPEVIGEYAERQKASKKVWSYAIVSVIGVFLILHASFKSLRLATLAMVTLPSALVGGVLAAYLHDDPQSFRSVRSSVS